MSAERGLIASLSGEVRTLFLAASESHSLLEKSLPEDLIQLALSQEHSTLVRPLSLFLSLTLLGLPLKMLMKFA